MNGNIKKQSGFTLIEILVATSMFLIIFVIIADLAIMFTRNPEELIRQKKLEREADYIMEFMTQKIRNNKINYTRHTSLDTDNPVEGLYLIDADGEVIEIEKNGEDLHLNIESDGENINSNNFVIDEINFYIYPDDDPFDYLNGINEQPGVTINLQAHYKEDGVDYDGINIILQTTVTSRIYER